MSVRVAFRRPRQEELQYEFYRPQMEEEEEEKFKRSRTRSISPMRLPKPLSPQTSLYPPQILPYQRAPSPQRRTGHKRLHVHTPEEEEEYKGTQNPFLKLLDLEEFARPLHYKSVFTREEVRRVMERLVHEAHVRCHRELNEELRNIGKQTSLPDYLS